MKLQDLLEAATTILYHSTRLYNAAKILEQGFFKLAASVGTGSELAYQKPGKFYYFSTTRSKMGEYTLHNYYIDGVVFNLNGDWINQRYTSAPIDYWERLRASESEDRVYSTKPIIPLPDPATKLIKSIHVLYQQEKVDKDDKRPYWLRKLLLNAKLKNIPIYVYTDPQAWLLQDNRKIIDIKTLIGLPEPVMDKPWSRMPRDRFKAWRELYYKDSRESLSTEGKRIVDRLQRDYFGDTTRSLESDIHNQKSENDPALIKLLDIFRRLKINSTAQYVEYLKKKWADV